MLLKISFFSIFVYLILSYIWVRPNIWDDWPIKQAIDNLFKGTRKPIIYKLEKTINSSNIKKYIPWLNIYFFLLTVILFFGAAFYITLKITHTYITSLFVAMIIGFLPKGFLEFATVINEKKLRKEYLGFLNVYYGFFNLSGDVVGAFRKSANYTGEPLKSFINSMVYRYDRSNIDFIQCLDFLAENIKDREFLKFIKFTKLYLIYGGDYEKALEKLIEQARKLENARISLTSTAIVGIFVIVIFSMLDIASLLMVYLNNLDVAVFLRTSTMGQILVLFNLITVCIGYYFVASFYRG